MAVMPHVFDRAAAVVARCLSLKSNKATKRERGTGRPARGLSLSVALQGALHELSVAFEVQQAVAAVVERNHGLLVAVFRLEGEIDRSADRVARLRRGNQALRLCKDFPRLECAELVHRAGLDEPRVQQDAQRRRGPMVPQAARVAARWDERT